MLLEKGGDSPFQRIWLRPLGCCSWGWGLLGVAAWGWGLFLQEQLPCTPTPQEGDESQTWGWGSCGQRLPGFPPGNRGNDEAVDSYSFLEEPLEG